MLALACAQHTNGSRLTAGPLQVPGSNLGRCQLFPSLVGPLRISWQYQTSTSAERAERAISPLQSVRSFRVCGWTVERGQCMWDLRLFRLGDFLVQDRASPNNHHRPPRDWFQTWSLISHQRSGPSGPRGRHTCPTGRLTTPR